MDQAEQFLREIRRHPDDAVVRLIYADWLEEQGDPHAELIRLQCQLHGAADEQDSRGLLEREQELLRVLTADSLHELEPAGVRAVEFSRGFVETVTVEGSRFLPLGRLLQRWAPALRCLTWQRMPRDAAEALQRLLRSPFFAVLNKLHLSGNSIGRSGITVLAESRRCENFRVLGLNETRLAGQGMQDLVDAPLWSVEQLYLADNELSPFDVRALTRTDKLASLTVLDLRGNHIADEGLRLLSHWPRLQSLKVLDLTHNDLGPSGLRAIADSRYLTNLETLRLGGNSIHGDGAHELAVAANFARLRELSLVESGLEAADVDKLARSPYLRRLTHLDLGFNPLHELSAAVWQAPFLENLRHLGLRHTQLDEPTARDLTQCEPLLGVQTLDLRDNPMLGSRARRDLAEHFGPRVLL